VFLEHHQGFNSSIGTFHKIQTSLQTSQHRVRTLKESLTQAKSNLSTAKPELKDFATASQNYDEMVQVLSVMYVIGTVATLVFGCSNLVVENNFN